MTLWHQHILGHFTANLSKLWVACDPDGVLLDEKLLSELRARGFEVMPYEDPFAFRTEFEERYRAAWDADQAGPSPALIVHVRCDEANSLPWDIVHRSSKVRLILAELFPKLAYSAVRQVEPEWLAALFHAHQTELQTVCGEGESKDFILEHVYRLTPRAIRNDVDFWREVLRLHFANRAMPEPFAEHAADILQGKGVLVGQPVAVWLASKSVLLRVVQDAWYRYLTKLGLEGRRASESDTPSCEVSKTNSEIDIPFGHADVRAIIDSMFLDGSLRPLAIFDVPACMPDWVKVGIVEDIWSRFLRVGKSIDALIEALPAEDASHREWGEFAKRYGEILNRVYSLPSNADEHIAMIRERVKTLQKLSDERLQAWVAAQHYTNLISQPATKGPVMVHHVPRFLRQRRNAGELKVALLVFDGLAFDQWVKIREHLITHAKSKSLAFDENAVFAWLPTVTSVSRQALFSGMRPREFDESINHTNKEESLWKAFWQDGGLAARNVMYRRTLRQVEQLDALQADIANYQPKVLGLIVDEVDTRLHKERSKEDVAMWIGRWLETGFVERLFGLLLNDGFNIYVTADHGNVEAVGVGNPNQGVIAETRGERVRVYRSEPLRAESAATYPDTISLDIAGLPSNFMALFAGGRSAFVSAGDRVVAHGGISVEELIVPFVKVSSVDIEG